MYSSSAAPHCHSSDTTTRTAGPQESDYKISYYDKETGELGEPGVWVSEPGKAKVEYASGDSYDGEFNDEKMKHGQGTYTWMGEENDDGERAVKATYTGSYADGKRCGVGKMTFPNGDVYEGEWKDNKVRPMPPLY